MPMWCHFNGMLCFMTMDVENINSTIGFFDFKF